MFENLYFGAKLRIAKELTYDEYMAVCLSSASAVGLEKAFYTVAGTDTMKGLSGGETRRLSIAMALLCSPKVLCFDGTVYF